MPQTSKLKNLERLRLTFFVLAIFIAGLVVYTLPRITIPLGISYVLYLILKPFVSWLNRLGIKSSLASLIIVISSLFVFTYPIVKIVPTVVVESQKIQYYMPKVESYLRVNYVSLKSTILNKTGFDIGDKVFNEIGAITRTGGKAILLNLPKMLGSAMEWYFVVPLFLFFFLKDSKRMQYGLLKIVPNSMLEKFYHLTYQFNKKLGDYIFAKFVEASIVGILITTGLAIFDIRFSLILGLIAAITNIIPYVGPIIGAIPAILFGLAEYGMDSQSFMAIVAVFTIANAIDLGFVFPILVSKLVDMHPMVVVTSVILGSQMMGTAGMIISIPLAAILKLMLSEIYKVLYLSDRRT